MNQLKTVPTTPQHLIKQIVSQFMLPFSFKKKEQAEEREVLQVDIRRRWRQVSRSSQNQRHVDIPPYTHRTPPGKQPCNNGRHRADEPEPLQSIVNCTGAEDSSGTDGAPDDTRGVKHLLARTCVLIRLKIGAKKRHNIIDNGKQNQSSSPCGRGKKREPPKMQKVVTYQTSGIYASAQFITAICTIADQMLATSCEANMVRGGTFM